jgi:hypothetical protein
MATINTLAISFLLLKSLVSSEALFAEEITHSLNPRNAIYGGWALSSPSCPADTTLCKSGDNAPSCCPNEYECQYDASTYQHFCCTTGKFPALLFSEPLLACLRIIMDMIDRDELPDDDPKHPRLCEHELEHVRTDISEWILLLFGRSSGC